MSATNDFLPFATGGGANVESQASYSADATRTNGNQPGIASSALNNKAIRQASVITSQLAQAIGNLTNTDVLDDTNLTKLLAQMTALLTRIAPVVTRYTSGSGNHNLTYQFFIASGNATAGATYTNNGVTYTVTGTISAGLILAATGNGAPTVSGTLTKASGTGDAAITFYAVRAPIALEVFLVGGGGGGEGQGSGHGAGGTGGTTTFGTSLLTANGGTGGGAGGTSTGGVGGTVTVAAGPLVICALQGASGNGTNDPESSPPGASSPFGGAAGGTPANSSGQIGGNAIANSGSGASGATSSANSGGSGAAGGYIHALITSLLSTYPYSVGVGGTAGAAGTSPAVAGGVGGSGVIVAIEKYQ